MEMGLYSKILNNYRLCFCWVYILIFWNEVITRQLQQ